VLLGGVDNGERQICFLGFKNFLIYLFFAHKVCLDLCLVSWVIMYDKWFASTTLVIQLTQKASTLMNPYATILLG